MNVFFPFYTFYSNQSVVKRNFYLSPIFLLHCKKASFLNFSLQLLLLVGLHQQFSTFIQKSANRTTLQLELFTHFTFSHASFHEQCSHGLVDFCSKLLYFLTFSPKISFAFIRNDLYSIIRQRI